MIMRKSSFTKGEVRLMESRCADFAFIRDRTRAALEAHGNIYEKLAVSLAKRGYGVDTVATRSGIPIETARLLVLGRKK